MMNKGDILVLQRILGHTKIEQTMAYSHFSPEHLIQAVHLNPLRINGDKMATDTVIYRYLAVLFVRKAAVFTVAFCYLEPNFIYSQSRITLPESLLRIASKPAWKSSIL